jgi:acetylornithine deacetylase/succinyl-diaminopimelate desuccinylase-like protein
MAAIDSLAGWINRRIRRKDFQTYLTETLRDLCSLPTVPVEDIRATAENEMRSFALIERAISTHGLAGRFERRAISEAIAEHPSYTFPSYAGVSLPYRGRCNLLFLWDSPGSSAGGPRFGVNAHIDTVAPFLPVRVEDSVILGRGACDDKSGCTVMIAALRLLREIHEEFAVLPGTDLTFMFVIDEEMGGNGSLSLSLDEELMRRCDVMVVLECCDQQVYPANRGALWYRVSIPRSPAAETHQPLLLAAEIILELEKEGAAIKSESEHILFPSRPVQTSHGILGPFGEHPSRICGFVELELRTNLERPDLDRCLEQALLDYTRQYGDKTAVMDGRTGRPKVAQHYALENRNGELLLKVWGCTGHMASILENDNALTKAAFLLKGIAREDGALKVAFPGGHIPNPLVLEGGQGFVPTHSIDQVQQRLRGAVLRAAARRGEGEAPEISFEKLHNDAFDGDPESPLVNSAVRAAELAGLAINKPIAGWSASCDARLFARARPDMQIITTGPGRLEEAHSDQEKVSLSDLAQSCAMLTLLILLHTGAVVE